MISFVWKRRKIKSRVMQTVKILLQCMTITETIIIRDLFRVFFMNSGVWNSNACWLGADQIFRDCSLIMLALCGYRFLHIFLAILVRTRRMWNVPITTFLSSKIHYFSLIQVLQKGGYQLDFQFLFWGVSCIPPQSKMGSRVFLSTSVRSQWREM